MRGLAAAIGAYVGLRALDEMRTRRLPCGLCVRMETSGLAPIVAAGLGGLCFYLLADELIPEEGRR